MHLQSVDGYQRIVRVVRIENRRLVGQDEDVAEPGELLRYRRIVGIAHQDVLVLFLHQFIARRHNHLDDVLAGREHGRIPIDRCRGVIGHARCSSFRRACRSADCSRTRWGTGTCRCRAPAAAGSSCACRRSTCTASCSARRRPACLRFKRSWLVQQREIEWIGGRLAGAVHVRDAIRTEALRPVIPTAGLSGVNQLQRVLPSGAVPSL